jgi:hypothetical protein
MIKLKLEYNNMYMTYRRSNNMYMIDRPDDNTSYIKLIFFKLFLGSFFIKHNKIILNMIKINNL